MTVSRPGQFEIAEELGKQVLDPWWRITSGAIYDIITKDEANLDDPDDELAEGDIEQQANQPGVVVPFIPNEAQLRFLSNIWYRNLILKARQLGFCVEPNTLVLKADLTWKRIGDLLPGDEVIGVDEATPGGKGQSRKMRTATVQAVASLMAEAFRITFEDGRSVVCTDRHPWLSRKAGDQSQWRSLSGKGNGVVGRLKVGTLVRWITKPWGAGGFEDGWMGGMLDGEGSMAQPHSSGAEVNVSQRPGPVWDRLVRYAADRGYSARVEEDDAQRASKFGSTPVPKLCFTRMDEMFRLIGQTRPTRFLDRRFWEGKSLPGKRTGEGWSAIVSIEPLGRQEMIDLQTSTGTYIAEGFVSHNTTLIALLWLDHAQWNANQNVGMIAQSKRTAAKILRGKVRFAYDRQPEIIRLAFPLRTANSEMLVWEHNNSTYEIATTMRGDTLHRLHISELGAIARDTPLKADEAVNGSLPSVSPTGIACVESTAEGMDGEFYEMSSISERLHEQDARLTPEDYRFHFFAWHDHPLYRRDPKGIFISAADHEYFDQVGLVMRKKLDLEQRAWWVAKRDGWARGRAERMWKQFPSTPKECWQLSTEGVIYAEQLTLARLQGRIRKVPFVSNVPVNTFWDIGSNDGTGIWFHQHVGAEHRFLRYMEGYFKGFAHFIAAADKLSDEQGGIVWGRHFLPHDAEHVRQGETQAISPLMMLRSLKPSWTYVIVPRVAELQHGIEQTRGMFGSYVFDEDGCAVGLAHLQSYRKKFNKAVGGWMDEPVKDKHTEAPDALRQHAQGWRDPSIAAGSVAKRNPRHRRIL